MLSSSLMRGNISRNLKTLQACLRNKKALWIIRKKMSNLTKKRTPKPKPSLPNSWLRMQMNSTQGNSRMWVEERQTSSRIPDRLRAMGQERSEPRMQATRTKWSEDLRTTAILCAARSQEDLFHSPTRATSETCLARSTEPRLEPPPTSIWISTMRIA